MENTLIQTKLYAPRVSGNLVERPHLVQRLNQDPNRTFTLVSAPAGYGKTTLISSWLAKQQAAYAWISLDEFDNNPAVFLWYIVAAFQQLFPGACIGLAHALQAPDLPSADLLTTIVINELSQLPERTLLILDDYQVLHNSNILQLVERVLNQPQNQLHLVIISRVDPLLPLPRLRLQRGMVELRRQELRFSDQEAEEFLRTTVAGQLDPETIVRLNQHVEGWIAGLRLATLTVQHPQPASPFSLNSLENAQTFIANYLFTEVLAQQPLEVQEFLLQTAFLDRFCPDLGREIVHFSSPNISAAAMIEDIQQTNLFIIPLDEAGGWYRYHHLFQQMLQQKAAAHLDEAAILALHNRAGDWFALQGFVDEALHHYLDAGSIESAVFLIEQNSHNLLNGLERRRLEHWLEILPEEIVWQRPRLLVAKAWLFYRHGRLQALAAVLTQLQHCLAQETVELTVQEQRAVRGQLNALQSATLYLLNAAPQKSIAAADSALSQLPAAEQGAIGTALGYWATSMQAQGKMETAVFRLQQALADPTPLGPAVMQLYLSLSFVQLVAGNLPALKQIVDQFSALIQKTGVGAPAPCWASGIYHYEINQLDKARKAFETTVSLHYGTNFIAAFDSWLALARICQEQGDFVGAQTYLDAVQAETLHLDNHELLPVIEAVRAYQSYLERETAVCLRWAHAFDPEQSPEWVLLNFIPLFFWVRILAAHGGDAARESARQTLKTKLRIAQKNHQVRRQIQLLVHLALLENRLGDAGAALSSVQDAVQLAEPGGFVRTFVDCGAELRPYLQQLQTEAITPHFIAQILAAYSPNDIGGLDPAPIDHILTNREAEILGMMQAGFSNREIARDLVISYYTVKRHASNIYRKLDVDGRHQAINKAKKMGILT